jgi:selenide,water dikinase
VTRLVLLGGGHAHALVLLQLRASLPQDLEVKLVTPQPVHTYSGMVPGVLAGHYRVADAQIDLARLAASAGVELVLGSVTTFDADAKCIWLEDGGSIAYDIASLNTGSLPSTQVPGSAEHALGIKPFETFMQQWEARALSARRIAVVGAGAGGVEIAMAIRYRLPSARVILFSDRPMFSGSLAARLARALQRGGVELRAGVAVTALESGPVVVTQQGREPCDLVLWTAGAAAQPWLRQSGLQTDAAGFVLVDPALRSYSHPDVFAAGDCATLRDARHPKSGVYAVRHAPVLAANLVNLLQGRQMQDYVPQPRQLALISCGEKYALACRGGWSAEGAWVWRWKDWLDRRWIARFSRGG